MTEEKEIKGSDPAEVEAVDEGEVLAWKCHPVRRRPLISVLVSLLILVVGAAILFVMQSSLFAAFSVIVLFAALAKFYWPTSYQLSDRKIRVKTTTQTLIKEWTIYRSCYADKNGILLSPFAEPTRLENFRGLYIMFDNNREEVTAFVKARIGGKHLKRTEASVDDQKNGASA